MSEASAPDIPEVIYTEAGQWLGRLEAGEPGVQAKIDHWLASDPRHRRAYDFTSRFLRESAGLGVTAVGADGRLPAAPFHLRRRTHVVAATLATVLLAGTMTILLIGREGLAPFAPSAQAATYETRVGEVRDMQLADGTRITLDTDTRLSVLQKRSAVSVELTRGRFRAETRTGARSFVIAAGRHEVMLEGSSFDAVRTGPGVRIVAVDAPVEIAAQQGGTPPRVLEPGAREPQRAGDPSMPDIRSDTRWVAGMLTLDATPLAEAITAINRYNTTKIRVAAPDLADRRVSGAFRVNDPRAFADTVARLFAVRVERTAGEFVLHPAAR